MTDISESNEAELLQRQIAELQARLLEVRRADVERAIARAKAIIEEFGLTADDLFSTGPKSKVPAAKERKIERKPVLAKFRSPQGDLWSGRGIKPRWVTQVLAEGKSIDDYRIEPVAEQQPPVAADTAAPAVPPPVPPKDTSFWPVRKQANPGSRVVNRPVN